MSAPLPLLDELLDATIELQRAEFGTVQLYDKRTGTLGVVAQRGFASEFLAHFRNVEADGSYPGARALKQRVRTIIEDVMLDAAFEPHRHFAAAVGFRGVQSTPLIEHGTGEPIGVLSTYFRDPHRPSARDLRLTDVYARQAAAFIASAVSQARLRESEERLRAALVASGTGTFRWDILTNVIWVDESFDRLLGLPASEPERSLEQFLSLIHPDDRRMFLEKLLRCQCDGLDFEMEYRVIRPDGAQVWLYDRGKVFCDATGRPSYRTGAWFDVTERKRAEASLREDAQCFEQFAAHSTEVLWLVDVQTSRHEFISAAFERVWGRPIETGWSPSRWIETAHAADRERVSSWYERVLQGEDVVLEYRIVRPDGAVRWIRDSMFPIRDDNGRVRRVGGNAQDITNYTGSLVYVVDADDRSRHGLSSALRAAGYHVKAFASARTFLEVAPTLVAGCVVVDIRAPSAAGLVIPQELRTQRIRLPVIVLGDCSGDVYLGVQAMKAGAADFLPMPYEPDALLMAIATALAEIRDAAERNLGSALVRARIAEMPARPRRVLELMLLGGTNKSIAKELGISPRTVEIHRAHAMERLGAKTLRELVLLAMAAGLLPSPA